MLTLTNSGTTEIRWHAVVDAAWLRLSRDAGTLAPGQRITVIVSVDDDLAPTTPWTALIALPPSQAVVTLEGGPHRRGGPTPVEPTAGPTESGRPSPGGTPSSTPTGGGPSGAGRRRGRPARPRPAPPARPRRRAGRPRPRPRRRRRRLVRAPPRPRRDRPGAFRPGQIGVPVEVGAGVGPGRRFRRTGAVALRVGRGAVRGSVRWRRPGRGARRGRTAGHRCPAVGPWSAGGRVGVGARREGRRARETGVRCGGSAARGRCRPARPAWAGRAG
ncbi:hypothetical protein ACFQ0M_22545 [Kitasatospora aburaviensis]